MTDLETRGNLRASTPHTPTPFDKQNFQPAVMEISKSNKTVEHNNVEQDGVVAISELEVVLFDQPSADGDGFQEVISREKRLKHKSEERQRSSPRPTIAYDSADSEPRRSTVPYPSQ